jgi:hypothetical protein
LRLTPAIGEDGGVDCFTDATGNIPASRFHGFVYDNAVAVYPVYRID